MRRACRRGLGGSAGGDGEGLQERGGPAGGDEEGLQEGMRRVYRRGGGGKEESLQEAGN